MLLSATVMAATKGLQVRWLLGNLPADVFVIGRATARRVKCKTSAAKKCMLLDLRKGEPCIFDGTCGHGVQPFRGERFSIVFFTMRRFERVAHTTRRALRRVQGAGGDWPTRAALTNLNTRMPAAPR